MCTSALLAVGYAASDEITSLPNLNVDICWKQYSGYVPVADGKKSLFYWYHEATSSPETKPLVLWLNGMALCVNSTR